MAWQHLPGCRQPVLTAGDGTTYGGYTCDCSWRQADLPPAATNGHEVHSDFLDQWRQR
jgi:hypothetical protein